MVCVLESESWIFWIAFLKIFNFHDARKEPVGQEIYMIAKGKFVTGIYIPVAGTRPVRPGS